MVLDYRKGSSYFVPHTWGQIGGQPGSYHAHSILFLYLDEEVDLINELLLGYLV